MPPEIPDIARDAARKYLAGFDRATVLSGEGFFARGAVKNVEPFDGEVGCYADVAGTQTHEVAATFDAKKKRWLCDCDCEAGGDCEHCYAVVKTLLSQGPAAVANEPEKVERKPPTGVLAEAFREAVGRKLTEAEEDYLHRIAAVFAKAQSSGGVFVHDFATLGISLPGFHWDRVAAWPSPPSDAREFWFCIAVFAEVGGLSVPDFMRPLRVPAAFRERMAKWRRGREVDRWKKLLSRLPEAEDAVVGGDTDLRLRFRTEEAVVEARRGGAGEFEPMKAAAFRELPNFVTSTLTPEAALLRQFLEERADFG